MGVEDMPDVKQRMIDIVNSVPDDYFDGLKPTEMVFKLMVEYIKRYGEDETTIIPGTDKHFNYENLKKIYSDVPVLCTDMYCGCPVCGFKRYKGSI